MSSGEIEVPVEVTVEDSWKGETVVTEVVGTKLANEVLVPTPVPGGGEAVRASVSEVTIVLDELLADG